MIPDTPVRDQKQDLRLEPEPEPVPDATRVDVVEWRRTAIGHGGQMRWVPQREMTQRQRSAAVLQGTEAAICCAKLEHIVDLLDRAHLACPLVPIHTSHRDAGTTGHELAMLRRAGSKQTHQEAATQALHINRAACTALQQIVRSGVDPLVAFTADRGSSQVEKLVCRIQAQAASFEALQNMPVPRPMAEFDEAWRTERVFPFSTHKHNLYKAVSDMVMMGWATEPEQSRDNAPQCASPDLSRLHMLPQSPDRSPGCPALLMEFKLADPSAPWSPPAEWGSEWVKSRREKSGSPTPAAWFNAYRKRGRDQHTVGTSRHGSSIISELDWCHPVKFRESHQFRTFLEVYRRFVAEIVVPIVDDPRGVLFQCPPTLRIVLPSDHAVGKVHKDADYGGHEDSEINFWVPITDVSGATSLHLESSPGCGDYRPMDMCYGEALRFNGLNCMHHTVPNSSDRCRVSFDFRVLPRSFWRDDFARRTGSYDLELAV